MKSNHKYLVFAPSYAGKTTAHRAGTMLDLEEVPAYKEAKAIWARTPSEDEIAGQRIAYATLVGSAISGDAPIIVTHIPPVLAFNILTKLAAQHGRFVVLACPIPSTILLNITRALKSDPTAAWVETRTVGAVEAYHRAALIVLTASPYYLWTGELSALPSAPIPWDDPKFLSQYTTPSSASRRTAALSLLSASAAIQARYPRFFT